MKTQTTTSKSNKMEDKKQYLNSGALNVNMLALGNLKQPLLIGSFTTDKGEEKSMRLWHTKRFHKKEENKDVVIYQGNFSDKDTVFKKSSNNAGTITLYPYTPKTDISGLTREEKAKYPILSGKLITEQGQIKYVKVWEVAGEKGKFLSLKVDEEFTPEEKEAFNKNGQDDDLPF
eukprot:TRINITY_DN13151_c0_g1_i1.p1 TRINITY_DN13151_c0_g1~~TRINITY_DN13151_c0_g1_i1.p1  ORF type:complete len:175 (+),score=18.09 TRINITY_DN13151_c0_g1_i1:212-736(+)